MPHATGSLPFHRKHPCPLPPSAESLVGAAASSWVTTFHPHIRKVRFCLCPGAPEDVQGFPPPQLQACKRIQREILKTTAWFLLLLLPSSPLWIPSTKNMAISHLNMTFRPLAILSKADNGKWPPLEVPSRKVHSMAGLRPNTFWGLGIGKLPHFSTRT